MIENGIKGFGFTIERENILMFIVLVLIVVVILLYYLNFVFVSPSSSNAKDYNKVNLVTTFFGGGGGPGDISGALSAYALRGDVNSWGDLRYWGLDVNLVPYIGAIMDLNILPHSFLAYDVNATHNFHVGNAIYSAYLCDNFGVSCLDMTGDPWYFGNVDLSVDGNIFPATTLWYNLGSGANRWNNLFVRGVNAESVNVSGDINGGRLRSDFNMLCDSSTCYRISDLNITSISSLTDTNWQTGWSTFDSNMKNQFRLYSVDLNTTGLLKSDSNKLCDSNTCYKISDLNITGGTGSSQWTTAGTEIYYDGNVGINVHNPTTALDINGAATLRDIGISTATVDVNILVDGNFASDPTGIWTMGTGWSWDSNSQARHIGNGGAISTASIDNPGLNYAVGDYIRINGGSLDANYRVTSVGGDGRITGLVKVSGGTTYKQATNVTTFATSGLGSGLLVSITQIVDGNTMTQGITIPSGNYLVTFESKSYSTGKIKVSLGSASGYVINTGVFALLSTNGATLTFTPTADFNGVIDNVSINKINSTSSVLNIDNNDNSVGIEVRPGGNTTYNFFIGTSTGKSTYHTATANSGYYNTGIGSYALEKNTTGAFNNAYGYSALRNNTTGIGNVAIGAESLRDNLTGSYNQAMGSSSLIQNVQGVGNIAYGFASMATNKSGSYNTAIGYYTLAANTTANYNVAIGSQVLGQNTSGSYNHGIGYASLYSNTTGAGNTGIGMSALYNNYNGNYNTAIGYQALTANTTASHNIGIGYTSLRVNTTGASNVGVGNYTFYNSTTGQQNTGVGTNSLYYLTTQTGNTALGYNSGVGTTLAADYNRRSITDSYSTFLGYQASRDNSAGDSNVTPITNATAIGKNAKVAISNAMVLGGTGTDAVKVGIGTIRPTQVLDVNGTTLIRTDLNVLNQIYMNNQKLGPDTNCATLHSCSNVLYLGDVSSSTTDTNALITQIHKDGNKIFYKQTTDSDTARGTILVNAINSAQNGDVFYLAPATFDIGTSYLDLSIGSTGTVSLHGSGMYQTLIKKTSGWTFGYVNLGDYSELTDLSISGAVGPSSAVLYVAGNTGTNITVKNVKMHTTDIGVFIYDDNSTINFFNVDIQALERAFDIQEGTLGFNKINIYDSNISINTLTWGVSALSVLGSAIVNVYNSKIVANCPNACRAVRLNSSDATVKIFGGILSTTGTGSFDLYNGAGNLGVTTNTDYSYSKISGVITYLDSNNIVTSLISLPGASSSTFLRGDGTWSAASQWSTNGTSIYYSDGNVGIGTNSPSFKLVVDANGGNDYDGVSIWTDGNVSAPGYITRTKVFDKSKGKALSFINDAASYFDEKGNIDHSSFNYSAVSYPKKVLDHVDYVYEDVNVCKTVSCSARNEKECKPDYVVCEIVSKKKEVPVYVTVIETGVSLDSEVALLKQAIFEIKDCAANSKSWEEYKKCLEE